MALGTAPDLASILQAVQDRMRVGSGPLPQWGGYQAPALPTRPVGNLSSWDRLWQPAQIPATNTVTLPHRIPGATMQAPDPFPMTPSAEPLPSWSGYTPPVRVNPVQLPQGVGVNEAQIGNLRPITSANMEIPPLASSAFNNPTAMPSTGIVNGQFLSPVSESTIAGLRPVAGDLAPAISTAESSTPGFLQSLKTNALLKSPAVDATTVGLEAAPTLTGAAKYLDYGKMGLKGIGKGLGGLAISTGANALADTMPLDSNARPGIRAMGNVGGAMFALPAIGGGLAATAAVPGVGAAEAASRTSAGNEIINAQRNASTNPLANAATLANPVSMLMNLGFKVKDVINGENGGDGRINLGNRTNDTVFSVLGGGNDNAAQAAAPVVTPEQRLAQTSPDSLAKIATDYGLSDAMQQKLIKNYNQAMVMAKTQGAVSLPVGEDGKLDDGTNAADYPGAKQVSDGKGGKTWVTTNPADIQQSVFEQATQLIPSLGHAQEQEEDFFRKQAVMQSQLEQVLPQLYNPAIWGADPTAQTLAMSESRAIPSRYVQAQALQAQQAYDNQIAQAMQQQQLAAQYPELFGKKSSSSQPATLDAAMAQ